MEKVTILVHQPPWFGSRKPGLVRDGALQQVAEGVEIGQEPPIFRLVASLDRGVGRCDDDGVLVDGREGVSNEGFGVRGQSLVRAARNQRVSLCHLQQVSRLRDME